MKRIMYFVMAAAMLLTVSCKNGNKNAQDAAEAVAAEVAEGVENIVEGAASDASEALENAGENVRDLALEALDELKGAAETSATESLAQTLGAEDAVSFASVEEKPTFNGGDANSFSKWINSNVEYPQDAIDKGIEGKVILGFVVDEEGNVKNVKVLKGANELLDNAATAAAAKSPKWEPGKQNGTAVKVTYVMPVIFKLTK